MVVIIRVRLYNRIKGIISTTNMCLVSLIKSDYNIIIYNYLMAPFDGLTRLYYRVKAGMLFTLVLSF